MELPRDPAILLSFVNTKLRDEFPSLEELCAALDAEEGAVRETLGSIGYTYDGGTNRFI